MFLDTIGSRTSFVTPLGEDDQVIQSLGYKPEFKRDLSLWATFSVSFSVLGLIPSVASTMWYSIAYGGNAGLTWGFLIGMTGVMAVCCSMCEISSAYPTSGGLYYATAMLSPPKYKAILSWTVGWSNYFVQLTGGPAVGWSCASIILALKSFIDPTYVNKTWHTYLLTIAITFTCASIASLPTKWIARVNSCTSILNMIFLFISWIVILGGNNRKSQGLPKFNDNKTAWGIENFTDWPDGICMLMTFMAVIWTMSGFDIPFHIAEESSNSQISTPRAIFMTASIGGTLCFVYQLSIAYTIVNVSDVVNSEIGQPYVSFLAQILDRKSCLALASFSVILTFSMCFTSMIACSRVLFSYSRDNCFPMSHIWCHINSKTKTPVNAVWMNWFIGACLDLLMFGGVAIDAIFSLGAIGSFISFTFPTLLRITYARNTFKPGPWNMGKWTYFCGWYAVSFVLLMIPILNFPQYRGKDLTPELMNWTCLVYYGSMSLALAWYFIYAHKIFKGPKSNITNTVIPNYEEHDDQIKFEEKLSIIQTNEPKIENNGNIINLSDNKNSNHISMESVNETNTGSSIENENITKRASTVLDKKDDEKV
ncbi:hypothetical protein C6P40_002285 [Pichia californica]|uniref:Amino acid transporter n=1 Tax=Pichia californica TaxID=460514 RepID=A0A9P7BEW2_9ASCO|nr:hypothetical protein C6P40_002285 [[Candida] californica]